MGVLFTDFYTLPGYEFTTLEAHDACVANGAMSQLLLWFGARSHPPCPSRVVSSSCAGGRRSLACAGQLPQLHSDLARLAARRRCSLLFCTCIDRVVLQFAQACLRSSVRPPSIRRSVARDARPATSVSPRLCRPPHDSKRALAPRVCRCLL